MKKKVWYLDHYEEVTEITERDAQYLLTITYRERFREKRLAEVKVEDLSAFRLPLLFATTMSYEQANSYLELFRKCGYIDVRNVEMM